MRKVPPWLLPNSIVYFALHAFLFAVGLVLVLVGGVIFVAIGTSLIATGITGWVVFVHSLLSLQTTRSLEVMREFGLDNIFDGRSVRVKPVYDERLTRLRNRLDILGFGQKALREDYLSEFVRWKQRANIRILLIDPEYPSEYVSYARQRDVEERDSEGTIAQQVRQFIIDTEPVQKSGGKNKFEIRLYRCLPTVNIFRVDDDLFWGPYLIKEPSRNSPTFLVHKGGLLFERLTAHFESIWNDSNFSRPVPEEWLQ